MDNTKTIKYPSDCVRSEEVLEYTIHKNGSGQTGSQAFFCTSGHAPSEIKGAANRVRARLDSLIGACEMTLGSVNDKWKAIRAIENAITHPEIKEGCADKAPEPEPDVSTIQGKIDKIEILLEKIIMTSSAQTVRLAEIAQEKL